MEADRQDAEAQLQLQRACPPAVGTCPWDTRARRAKVPTGVWRGGGGSEEVMPGRGLPRAGPHCESGNGSPAWGEGDRARQVAERGVRPHVSEPQVPGGGACTPVCKRVCTHGHTREAGARAEGAAAHATLTPAPTPLPPPSPPGLDKPVTFLLSPHLFLLVAGVHVAVGVAGFKLQVPQAHGQTGCVWSGRGGRGHSGVKK